MSFLKFKIYLPINKTNALSRMNRVDVRDFLRNVVCPWLSLLPVLFLTLHKDKPRRL